MTRERYSKKFWNSFLRECLPITTEREPCIVCGKYKTITHAHHVVPVYEIAEIFERAGVTPADLGKFYVTYVWICPTHHELFHAIYNKSTDRVLEVIDDIGIEEYKSLEILWDLRDYKLIAEIAHGVENAIGAF